MTELEQLLKRSGPLLSGEIASHFETTERVSKEAIRKRLSRAAPPVSRLKGFFADNQSMMYLQEQYKKEEYFDGLREACKKSARRLYSIISALEYHNGFLHADHIATYSFSSVGKLKGHKMAKLTIEKLAELDVISFDDSLYRLNPYLLSGTPSNIIKYRAIETAKNFVLSQFTSWARNIGLTSFNTAKYHSEYGKFQWAFTSPSYIKSLTKFANTKLNPAFVVADILIGKEANADDVAFFIEKVNIVAAQRNASRMLPFLIVESVTPEALIRLKENGIIIAFVNRLFGNEYQELLKALINTITNAGAILKKNPNEYLNLLAKIDKLVEGKTNNLRGDLFELAVGFYHSQHCQTLDIGKQIRFEGLSKEIDVFAVYQDKVVIAECKGYKSVLTKQEVESFVSDKIPFLRDWLLDQPPYENKKYVFEIWSTGGFDSDAKEYLDEISKRTKKYKIEFLEQDQIKEKARETGSKRFSDMLQQYYFGDGL